MPPAAPDPRGSYGTLAKRGVVWSAVREGVRFIVLIPTGMLVARLLSPQESGIAAAAYFVMQLGNRLTQFGLGVSLVRAKNVTDQHVSSVFVLNLAAGGLASAFFAVAGPMLGGLIGSHEAASWQALVADRLERGDGLPVVGVGERVGPRGVDRAEATNLAARHVHTLRSRLRDGGAIVTAHHAYRLRDDLDVGSCEPSATFGPAGPPAKVPG